MERSMTRQQVYHLEEKSTSSYF